MKNNNKHKINIYRKPTQTDYAIHSTSNHPDSNKLSDCNSFVYRALNIPMEQTKFISEIN